MTSVSRILKPGARRTNQDTKEKETSIYTTQQAINRMRDYLDKNLPRQHLENNMEYTLEKFLHQGNPDSLWGVVQPDRPIQRLVLGRMRHLPDVPRGAGDKLVEHPPQHH